MITDECLWVIDYTFHLRFTMFPCFLVPVSFLFSCSARFQIRSFSHGSLPRRLENEHRRIEGTLRQGAYVRIFDAIGMLGGKHLLEHYLSHVRPIPLSPLQVKTSRSLFSSFSWRSFGLVDPLAFSLRLQFHGLNAWLFRNVVVCVSSPIGRKSRSSSQNAVLRLSWLLGKAFVRRESLPEALRFTTLANFPFVLILYTADYFSLKRVTFIDILITCIKNSLYAIFAIFMN